jgi:hypothetical protein
MNPVRIPAILLVASLAAGCAMQPLTATSAVDALAKLKNESNVTFSSTDFETKTTLRVAQPF